MLSADLRINSSCCCTSFLLTAGVIGALLRAVGLSRASCRKQCASLLWHLHTAMGFANASVQTRCALLVFWEEKCHLIPWELSI